MTFADLKVGEFFKIFKGSSSMLMKVLIAEEKYGFINVDTPKDPYFLQNDVVVIPYIAKFEKKHAVLGDLKAGDYFKLVDGSTIFIKTKLVTEVFNVISRKCIDLLGQGVDFPIDQPVVQMKCRGFDEV